MEYIDINKEILENIDIDIDKEISENIDIDKISNRLEFGISNRAIGGRLVACVLSAHRKNGGDNAVLPVRLGHEC